MPAMKKIFHILPNAHLDPVWFWNQHEGLNEGVKTCSTIVKLMDRFPELTFNRGEAAIYTCDFSLDYVHINADYTT